MIQRLFDILFSVLALIVLSPLFLPIVALLKLTGEGEIFYLQERVGKNKVIFRLFKFATMLKDSPNIGTGFVTMKNDTRVLPLGKFLRKTKINELPQLINILFGDMSVIGPRPQSKRCFEAFIKEHQEEILKVRPGLSGIGSIIFRDEEEILEGNEGNLDFYDNVIAVYKGELEAWYVKRRNILMYFILIFSTIWVILNKKSHIILKIYNDLPLPDEKLKILLYDKH